MRSLGLVALTVLVLVAPATAQARSRAVAGCQDRIGAGFSKRGEDRRQSIVVGPLSLVGAKDRADYTQAQIDRFGGDKFPVVLEHGRTATVRIVRAVRRTAAGYEAVPAGDVRFGRETSAPKMRFVACSGPLGFGDEVDGRAATAWMLWFSVKEPVCVYLRIAIDGRAPRRRAMSYGAGVCPRRDPLR
jgi:hypothetical protein